MMRKRIKKNCKLRTFDICINYVNTKKKKKERKCFNAIKKRLSEVCTRVETLYLLFFTRKTEIRRLKVKKKN